ncbi:MAG: hypothetical protein KIT51_04825 [Cyclobacteriaceae bacterium]|nr:MAG: hypothetical protein KIT51_04825 [Cyclobacteriaceae bacterium]
MKLILTTLIFLRTLSLFGQESKFNCDLISVQIKIKSDSLIYENSFIDKHKDIGLIGKSKADFELRYYNTPSLANGGHVIIISCVDNTIKAKKVTYWFSVKQDYEKRRINKTKVEELKPTKTWNSFFNTLDSMNFYNFPTMEEIRPKMKKYMTLEDGRVVEKRSMITDGVYYTFEIKIKDKIRKFSYHSPISWYKVYDHVDELKQAEEIKEFFKNNLTNGNSR